MGLFGNSNNGSGAARSARKEVKPALRLAWLGVKSADLMKEATFVEQVLKLPYIDEGNSRAGHHVRYSCGLELELVSGGTAWATRPKPRQGQPDLSLVPSFQVDDIDVAASRLHEREVGMTQIYEQGWSASFLFLDPERNLWQVSENRTEPAVQTDELSQLGALWLSVEDLGAAEAFYAEVLGLPLADEANRPRPITLSAEQYQQENLAEEPEPDGETTSPAVQTALSPTGALFFREGVRLALSPGGRRLEDGQDRVWGQDTAFLPGLLTPDLNGLCARLKAAGRPFSGPFSHYSNQSRQPNHHGRAIRFTDPEGHPWQAFD